MLGNNGIFDTFVIGGGVNGTGIAADAAGRGLNVMLCEMNDLASATSSNSSKLIHGGLRYLEHYEFRLVREALAEREVLLKKAPHIMWPMRFRLPHRPHLRPKWMLRAGLFLYDNLAKRNTLEGSRVIKFQPSDPLQENIDSGFEYSDGWVDDSRLVVLNAVSASEHGARIATQTQCLAATRITLGGETLWQLSLLHKPTNSSETVYAKALVNAGGPWVNDIFEETLKLQTPKNIRLIKGSHIVVPRIHNGDEAYILQNEDGRIVFVLPYEETFSLIGTTDVEFSGNPSSASLSDDELNYLLDVVNDHFIAKLSSQDVVSSFSGVRPLIDDASDDASEITRDYLIDLDAPNNQAPLVSIFGGKITTYRKLSEAAVDRLASFVPDIKPRWTANSCLPGGDFSNQEALINEMRQEYRWLTPSLARRYARTYGTLSHKFLSGTQCIEDMGEHFGAELYEREVEYLRTHEWACNAEDILWRRTKLGLLLTSAQVECLDTYLNKCRLAA